MRARIRGLELRRGRRGGGRRGRRGGGLGGVSVVAVVATVVGWTSTFSLCGVEGVSVVGWRGVVWWGEVERWSWSSERTSAAGIPVIGRASDDVPTRRAKAVFLSSFTHARAFLRTWSIGCCVYHFFQCFYLAYGEGAMPANIQAVRAGCRKVCNVLCYCAVLSFVGISWVWVRVWEEKDGDAALHCHCHCVVCAGASHVLHILFLPSHPTALPASTSYLLSPQANIPRSCA